MKGAIEGVILGVTAGLVVGETLLFGYEKFQKSKGSQESAQSAPKPSGSAKDAIIESERFNLFTSKR